MVVTKLPRNRDGTLSQRPPLSWPNDTEIGRHRPHLGLLRQATHNHQQHRMSNLSANIWKPTQHPSLHPQAPRASSFSSYKAHKRTHHSTQESKAPSVAGKPPNQNQKPGHHATQSRRRYKFPSSSRTGAKKDAKSQKNSHIAAAKSIDWDAYDRAKAHRLKQIRIWVNSLRVSHRIVPSVAKELMAYYGSERYGGHPAASTLSKHAWQAVKLCEHEFGTDLQWGKGLGEAIWGSEHKKVEKRIDIKMAGQREGTPAMGTVGESDLSELDDEGDEYDGDDEKEAEEEGLWVDEGDEDVVMAEAV